MQRSIAFGTDGVRGVANEGLLPEDATRLGLAAAGYFGGPILIGRDTRLSGEMLSAALAAGSASGGASVIDAGVLRPPVSRPSRRAWARPWPAWLAPRTTPTPTTASSSSRAKAASSGRARQSEIESLTARPVAERPTGAGVGAVRELDDAARLYVEGILERLRPRAGGMRVLLDCANGAAYEARSAGVLGARRRPHGRWGRAGRGKHKRGRRLHARRGSRRLGLRRRLRLRWGRGQGARQGREGQRGRRGQDSRHPGAGPQGARGARWRRDSHANEQPRLLQGDGVPRHPLRRHPRGRQARGRGDARAWGFARRGAVRARDPLRARDDRRRDRHRARRCSRSCDGPASGSRSWRGSCRCILRS